MQIERIFSIKRGVYILDGAANQKIVSLTTANPRGPN